MTAGTIIAEIVKNKRETVRIELGEFNGHNTVAARVYADTGEIWVPTRKGLTVRLAMLPDLIDGLQRAQAAAISSGLLSGDNPGAAPAVVEVERRPAADDDLDDDLPDFMK